MSRRPSGPVQTARVSAVEANKKTGRRPNGFTGAKLVGPGFGRITVPVRKYKPSAECAATDRWAHRDGRRACARCKQQTTSEQENPEMEREGDPKATGAKGREGCGSRVLLKRHTFRNPSPWHSRISKADTTKCQSLACPCCLWWLPC